MLGAIDPLYVASGFAVGCIVGLTGVGGGSLMTPLLVLLFHVQPATAVGTDLLYAAVTKTVGTAVHRRYGTVDWRIVGALAVGSVPASIATLLVLRGLGPHAANGASLISTLLGFALLLTALSLVMRNTLIRWSQHSADLSSTRRVGLTVAVGAAIGALVSISSVGAGAIGVTALFFLYPRLPARVIVGSDIAHAVPLTIVAGAGHWGLGLVDGHILASLLCGSIPGILLGSLLAPRFPDQVLRYLLAAVLALVGTRLVFA